MHEFVDGFCKHCGCPEQLWIPMLNQQEVTILNDGEIKGYIPLLDSNGRLMPGEFTGIIGKDGIVRIIHGE